MAISDKWLGWGVGGRVYRNMGCTGSITKEIYECIFRWW